LGPSPLALEAIRKAAAEVNLYPITTPASYVEGAGARLKFVEEQIFIRRRLAGILDVVARTLACAGTNCLSSERSFISYPLITRTIGGAVVAVPRNDAYDWTPDAEAINEQTRVVILATRTIQPGTMFDAEGDGSVS